jgi:hypothetical protein
VSHTDTFDSDGTTAVVNDLIERRSDADDELLRIAQGLNLVEPDDAAVAILTTLGEYDAHFDCLVMPGTDDGVSIGWLRSHGYVDEAYEWRERVDGPQRGGSSVSRGSLKVKETSYASGRREFSIVIPGRHVPDNDPLDADDLDPVWTALVELVRAFDANMDDLRDSVLPRHPVDLDDLRAA